MSLLLIAAALADSGGCVEDSGADFSTYEDGTCHISLCGYPEEGGCSYWSDMYWVCSGATNFLCLDCDAGGEVAHVAVRTNPGDLRVTYFDANGEEVGLSGFVTDFTEYCCNDRPALVYSAGVLNACLNPTPAVDPDTADTGATKTSSTADSKSCGGGQATVWAGLLALLGGSLLRRGSRP